jgi:hypothetical protein
MRIALALTLAATVVSVAMAAPRLRRVTGTAERAIHAQGPCSGGVAVTNEQMQEWAAKTQRFPLAKTTFTVFAGAQHVGKPVARFKTDRAGRFEVRLPEGVFCVMAGEQAEVAPEVSNEPPKPPATTSAGVDQQCLRDRALACDAQLHVRGDNPRDMKLTLDTFTPCPQPWAQPCYRGPMPP